MLPDSVIVHLASQAAWKHAIQTGEYRTASLESEGFIHCSLPGQVRSVANTWFAGQTGLVLVVLDPARCRSEVRMEPGSDRPEELFPHLYGPINLEAVLQVIPYEPGPNGRFPLPEIG